MARIPDSSGARRALTGRGRSAARRSPLRVLMLLENNPYHHDSRVRHEATTLAAAGHEVRIICPRGPKRARGESPPAGITLYQYPSPPELGGFLGYLVEYGYSMVVMTLLSLYVLARRGFDVVHAHNPPDTLAAIGALYKPFGKRFVFDHHDLSPEMYDARFGASARPALQRALRAFERFSFEVADHVIATNESHRRVAVTRGGVDPARVTVVRNGPDSSWSGNAAPDPSLRRGAATVLGYVGIMGPQDGVDHLLRALRHLVDSGRTDFVCYLIGKGDMIPQLEEMAGSWGLDDHVVFTGWVPSGELPRYLASVDICIDPDPSNPYNDKCTMIKMMEYMAFGKPIVAFDLPEHRISAGDAALYADPNDEADLARLIGSLMDDPDRRSRMGSIGRDRIESSLAWHHQAEKLLAVYETLAAP